MSSEQSVTGHKRAPGAVSGGAKHWPGGPLLIIGAAQLMVVLDATIVNVALPDIQ